MVARVEVPEKSEAMRHQACLPRSWWEFCVEYSVHVYNQTPIKRLKSKTPYEAINRDKPDISHLRILGCGAYVFLHEDVWQDVLSLHAELMTFIGFTGGVKGWKFMQNTNTIFHATKAVFDENMYPCLMCQMFLIMAMMMMINPLLHLCLQV